MATIKLNSGFALIVGAASGIGKETALTFAESGVAGIAFADIDKSKADAAADESKKVAVDPKYRAVTVQVDVSDAESVKSMVAYAVQEFGRIDYCVNSAGASTLTLSFHHIDIAKYFIPFSESPLEDYEKVMDINAKGVFLVTQVVSKQMALQEPRTVATTRNRTRDLGRGSIVNVSSVLCYGSIPYKVAYVTSKHAVLGLTKMAALEGGPQGIRVNCVCPSWVRTPMFDEECSRAPPTPDVIKAIVPAGRAAEPEEVSECIGFLCSTAGSYVNGLGQPVTQV